MDQVAINARGAAASRREITTLLSVLVGQLWIKMCWHTIWEASRLVVEVELQDSLRRLAYMLSITDAMVEWIFLNDLD